MSGTLVQSVGAVVYCSPRSVLRPAVERALTLADCVHGVSYDWPAIPVRAVNRGSRLHRVGSYTRSALLINSWYSDDSRAGAVLHELAHHLDRVVFGEQWYASEAEQGPLWELVEAAEASRPAREIERMAAVNLETAVKTEERLAAVTDSLERRRLEQMRRQAQGSVAGWLRLLEPKELFARAYEQWVVTEAATRGYHDPLLRWYPPQRPGRDHESRWSYEEFRPLAHALNRAFDHYGWLEPQAPVRNWRSSRRRAS